MIKIKNNQLYFGNIKAEELAKEFGTPLYVYDFEKVAQNIEKLKKAIKKAKANIKIYYAQKANSSLALLKFLKNKVDGVDTASPFEVETALKAGFSEREIMLTCPALTDKDLDYLAKKSIFINADSFSQIKKISKKKKIFQIGIRINPLIEIGAHSHIKTGGKYSKFGIIPPKAIEAVKLAKKEGLEVLGLHCHAGSNWLAKDLLVFEKIARVMTDVAKRVKKITNLNFLDFGGGIGIAHSPKERDFNQKELTSYAKIIKRATKEAGVFEARIEPGRFIIGNAGVLLTKVVHLSQGEKPIDVCILDAGFNIFARPFIYGAFHKILLSLKVKSKKFKKYLIGGNLCEGGDVFNTSKKELRKLPVLKEGDILAIFNAGAYGFSMSSQFNSRLRPAEIAILNGKVKLIRKRESFEDLIKNQIF